MKRLVFTAIVTFSVIIVAAIFLLFDEISYITSDNFSIRVEHKEDRVRFRYIIFPILSSIYSETGIMYQSLGSYCNSALYPYVEEYSYSLLPNNMLDNHGKIVVKYEVDNKISLTGLYIDSENRRYILAKDEIPLISKEEETKRKEKLFLSGVQQQQLLIGRYNNLINRLRKSKNLIGEKTIRLKLKEHIAIEIAYDLPSNDDELNIYIQWLKSVYGYSCINDAWGKSIQFSLDNNRLFCHSNGADGIRNTHDDITNSASLIDNSVSADFLSFAGISCNQM